MPILKRSGHARLKDGLNSSLSLESRFDLAYNAAHAMCLASLRWHGYRPSNRYIVFQLLPHTLGLGPEVWRVLSKCHDIRNLGEYEGDLNVDERRQLACRPAPRRCWLRRTVAPHTPLSGPSGNCYAEANPCGAPWREYGMADPTARSAVPV